MSARQLHRTLLRAALAGAQIFAWVAAYEFAYMQTGSFAGAFGAVVLTYALMHTVTILLLPLAARNMRHGSKRTLEAAVLCAAAAFAALGGMYLTEAIPFTWGMGAFALLMGLYRALYYVPYEISREKESRFPLLDTIVALMPTAAGILIATTWHIPQSLYFVAALLVVLSLVPVYRIPDRHEGFAWSYRGTFHELFDPKHRPLLFSSLAEGLEATALLLVWPIAAWLILDGSYPLLGVVLSATLLITMIARLVLRSLRLTPTTPVASALHVSAWVLRYFAGSAGAIIAIDIYAHAGGEPHKKGFDLATHEHVSDNHTYVDEYTTLREMGHALGRILMCFAIASLAVANSLQLVLGGAFALAAISGLIVIYRSRHHTRAAF